MSPMIPLAIPDRLPSLLLLGGFWIPPAILGWAGSQLLHRTGIRFAAICVGLAAGVAAWAAGWFFFQIHRMPPYIPGATEDPTFASPMAVGWLLGVSLLVVLPVSAVACALAFRLSGRMLEERGSLAR